MWGNTRSAVTPTCTALAAAIAVSLAAVLMPPPALADFGPVSAVNGAGRLGNTPQVAIGADGDGLVVWQDADAVGFHIMARRRSAAGVLGPRLKLSRDRDVSTPQVAMTADGDAVIVWHLLQQNRIQARPVSAAGVLGPIRTLSDAEQNSAEPQVAMDAAGVAAAVWKRFDGANDRIQWRTISTAGVLGPVRTLSAAGQKAETPRIAMNAGGDAVVVWRRSDDGANPRIQARTISAAGVLGAVQTLAGGENAGLPQVAMDAVGNAVVVWFRSIGRLRIQARTRSAAGVLGPVQTLSHSGHDADQAHVAMNANGQALAVWRLLNVNIGPRIHVSAGP